MVRSVAPLFAFAFFSAVPAIAAEPISLAPFRSVELEAGGDVSIVPGPVQRVTLVNGSREFTSFTIRRGDQLVISTSCDVRCPNRYNLRVQIETPYVPDVAVKARGEHHRRARVRSAAPAFRRGRCRRHDRRSRCRSG